jgi:hypothetical protein
MLEMTRRWRAPAPATRAFEPLTPRPDVRGALACLVALAVVLVSSTADAELKIKWDCYLPGTDVDCVTLESSLLSKIPFLRSVAERPDADVFVTLTSLPAEDGTRFLIELQGKHVDGYATEVHTTDKIPTSIDPTTAMVRIMTKLERGLDDFMDLKVAAEVKNGTLTLQLLDPVRLPFAGRPEQNSVKWFIAPSVSGYLSDVEGVGVNAWGAASLSFNYSEPKWRVQQWVGATYNEQSQPVPGTRETASIRFVGGNATNVISWGLSKDRKWNAGLLLGAEENPQANYKMRANGSLGIEFDIVPRQTVNQKNLGFHCAAGPELQHYEATNVEGIDKQLVGRQFCDAYVSWHFSLIDVGASLGETTVLKDVSYRSFSAGLSATWRITEDLTFSPWVNLQQVNKAINAVEPTNVVYSDPRQEIEASMMAAIEQGYTAPFGVQSGFSVKYILGNGSLESEDQRWKAASNLR